MRPLELAALISSSSALLTLALALCSCGVENAAPLSLPSSPGLRSMGTGSVICPPAPAECTGENQGRCCANNIDCTYKVCMFDGQVCQDDVCFVRCTVDADCAFVPGAEPSTELTCGSENLCVPAGCTSNRGCEAGQVCQGAEHGGICVPASEAEPDPGCSASAASSPGGAAIPAVPFLLLVSALVLARRRRSE